MAAEAPVTAVPVQEASRVETNSTFAVSGQAEVVSTRAPMECRRCGSIFTPGPEATPGSASFYRCPECTGSKAFMEDLPYAFCSIC
mmetsp:Transcript_23756/g.42315  ORF Transcript_23756/g.42315 Transcript_23756/m.42315 type:complete len:86 (+) Transcript_23756:196-453(+)